MQTFSNVYDLFNNITITDNLVKLNVDIDPKLWKKYAAKMKVIGGKWSSKHQSFEFKRNPNMLIDRLLELGSSNFNKFSLYETPKDVFDYIWDYYLEKFFYDGKNIKILEPNVGAGSLVLKMIERVNELYKNVSIELVCYEIDPINVEFCRLKGIEVTQADFLDVTPDPTFSIVLMNPPFDDQIYVKHVLHAHKFLDPRGVLVSVIPTTHLITYKAIDKLLDTNSDLHKLYTFARKSANDFGQETFGPNTFKGVKISTAVLEIDKLYYNSPEANSFDCEYFYLSNFGDTFRVLLNKILKANNNASLNDIQIEIVKNMFLENTPIFNHVYSDELSNRRSSAPTTFLPNLDYWLNDNQEILNFLKSKYADLVTHLPEVVTNSKLIHSDLITKPEKIAVLEPAPLKEEKYGQFALAI